jgi:hypothetical protein
MHHHRSTRSMVVLMAVALTAWAIHSASRPAHAAPRQAGEPRRVPVAPGPPPAEGGANASRIHELDQQIKALRADFHAQLDPLQSQVKALREKFEPRIASLVDQRKDLVEQGKPPEIQELDRQEAAELAALAEREKTEIEQVHQRFATERAEIERKYAGRHKEAHRASN